LINHIDYSIDDGNLHDSNIKKNEKLIINTHSRENAINKKNDSTKNQNNYSKISDPIINNITSENYNHDPQINVFDNLFTYLLFQLIKHVKLNIFCF